MTEPNESLRVETRKRVLIGGLGDGHLVAIPDNLRYYKHAIFPDSTGIAIGDYLKEIKVENYTRRYLRCDADEIDFWAEESMRDLDAIRHLLICHAKHHDPSRPHP